MILLKVTKLIYNLQKRQDPIISKAHNKSVFEVCIISFIDTCSSSHLMPIN